MMELVSVSVLKEDVKAYIRLETNGANGWEWYCTCALDNLLKSESVTLAYVNQMSKEEFDVTISLSFDIVKKFQSLPVAYAFVSAYKKYYGQTVGGDNLYENEILPLLKFIQQKQDK